MRRFIASVFVFIATLGTIGAPRADDRRYAIPFTPEWAAPQLDVIPYGGPPGTTVEITGHRFHKAVRVFYGDQPIPIVDHGKNYIVAVIPRYVRHDDFLYVIDSTGRARTRLPFDVLVVEHRRHDHRR
jgi:hypothetical protein